MASALYEYTGTQARVVGLYDNYRTALMNAKYYGKRLGRWKTFSVVSDIVIAALASAAFGSFSIWKTAIGENVFAVLLFVAVLLSVARPILKATDRIDRYSKLHYGYLEVFYGIKALVTEMRGAERVTPEAEVKAGELSERFYALELEADAYQNTKKLLAIQDEVDLAIPSEDLWLPQK